MTDWNAYPDLPEHASRRVFSVEIAGERYWFKRAAKDFKNRAQAMLASEGGLEGEVRAMEALKRRGARVPQVMHQSADFIVLSDIGESVQQAIWDAPARGVEYIEQVAEALSALHAAGGWHGNAMLRNFTLRDGVIGMIDFEDTAHAGWSIATRQAFDVWQVLYSAARFEGGEALAASFLKRYRPSGSARARLKRLAWVVGLVYLLFWPLKPWLKHDIRQAVIAVGALLAHRA